VSGELLHESVAELPDLVVGLSLGVEVASSESEQSQGDGREAAPKVSSISPASELEEESRWNVPLSSSDGEPSESVFEDLLESEAAGKESAREGKSASELDSKGRDRIERRKTDNLRMERLTEG